MITHSWIKKLNSGSKILIIHHWDTDGISSAALITRYLGNFGNFRISFLTPEIGTYRLIPKADNKEYNLDIDENNFSMIIILDYSVPVKDIVNLQEDAGIPVVIYDHHLSTPINKHKNIYYCNPVARGEPGCDWPSCTWVLKEFLGLEISDMVLMGIAGDMEERFIPDGFERFPDIKKYLDGHDTDYIDFVNAKDLIDIHYKENDRKALSELPLKFLEMEGDPKKILAQKVWAEKHKMHAVELNNLIKNSPRKTIKDIVEVRYINKKKNIISALTRRIAGQTVFRYVMVINNGFFKDKSQIYVRHKNKVKDCDTLVFKEIAASLDAQVGGKKDVAGIIMDRDKTDEYIELLRKKFCRKEEVCS